MVLVPVNTDDKWSPARGSGGPEMPFYEVPAPSLPQLAGRVLGTRETFGRSGLLCTHLHVYNKPSTQCWGRHSHQNTPAKVDLAWSLLCWPQYCHRYSIQASILWTRCFQICMKTETLSSSFQSHPQSPVTFIAPVLRSAVCDFQPKHPWHPQSSYRHWHQAIKVLWEIFHGIIFISIASHDLMF